MSPQFLSDTRLYETYWLDGQGPHLAVEAWWGSEALSAGFEYGIDLLSTDAHIDTNRLAGRAISLRTRLSDGSDYLRTGIVRNAWELSADGGFSRYRLAVVPWVWLLSQQRHSRVFQEQSVVAIVDSVFGDYRGVAAWQWTDEVASFLADARPRSYCVQYNETDYQFISRLLAEEGLGWVVEEDSEAPAGHRLTLFADSRGFAEDPVSASGLGIRYHRADSQEEQDVLVALGQHRQTINRQITGIGWNYKAKSAVAQRVPGGEAGPELESYEAAGPYPWLSTAEAERYGRLLMETQEVRESTWVGRGTVRSLRPGYHFRVSGLPAGQGSSDGYHVASITHLGINNLTASPLDAVAERLSGGLLPEDQGSDSSVIHPQRAPAQFSEALLAVVRARGYGNEFTGCTAALPWRPRLEDDTGARLNPRPTASGSMTALVVGPDGSRSPAGTGELWCDALGRVRVVFHWQQGERPDDRDTCWLRVGQRQAGAGMGWQWLPRIGQEVLVDFQEGDIDRPWIAGGLYNGRGEGGIPATPGGQPGESDSSLFDPATDHHPSGQGNHTGGNSPAWHGGASASHRHAAAMSGFKSKEFGGAGYNALVMDDSDQQQRVHLKTTQHMSELNLGHLIHQADNYRGSFRGTGVELRTDAWGAVRGGRGVLMSTWPLASAGTPAGDLAPGMALLKQADTLARTLSQAARTHHSVELASAIGAPSAEASQIDPDAAPIKALHTAASGMVAAADEGEARADAQDKHTQVSPEKRPHLTDAAIVQAARANFAHIAGQNLQYSNDETTSLESGADSNFAIAGQARLHTGQAIGLVAGAIGPGAGNSGIKLIAAKDHIDLQAQSDEMKFQAKQNLRLVSAKAHMDFAAAKKVYLAVKGGASITIDGGITAKCPGKITVHASKKSFNGPTSLSREMNTWPKTEFDREVVLRYHTGEAAANRKFEILREDGARIRGETDAQGKTGIQRSQMMGQYTVTILE